MTEDQQQQKLSALLRLKRFEQPPSGYYAKLLQDVHRRQRADLLRRPLWKIAVERIQTFFGEHSMGRLQYGGAMAAVLVTGLAIFGISGPSRETAGPAVAVAQAEPASPVATVDLRANEVHPRLLSLDRSFDSSEDEAVAVTVASLNHPVSNARLLPEQVTRTISNARPPRYIIDNRPATYEATAVSFRF
jgi:hypothetical protein